MREFKQTDTSTNAKMNNAPVKEKETAFYIKVTMPIFRWVAYSLFVALQLVGFLFEGPLRLTILQWVGVSLLLGEVCSQLNAIKNKK